MNSLISRTKPISQLLKPTSRTLFISPFSTSSPSPSPHYEKPVSEEKQSKSRSALNLFAKTDTTGNSEASLGIIPTIINWCKTWKNETGVSKPNEFQSPTIEPSPVEEDTRKFDEVPPSKNLTNEASPPRKHDLFTKDSSPPRKHDLFSKDSFWSNLQSFFKTKRGSEIVFNALSREQIADKLRKEGLLFLRPLQSIEIHHLVDLLITEKKWIKEFPTKNPRFKLVSLYEESSTPAQPHNPTRLSSIFSNPQSPDNSQLRVSSIAPKKISEKSPDNSQLRVSSTAPKKTSEKSRAEILSDCQKLLDEILSRHPDGFRIGLFKKQFLEKYGHALNHQKLGYPKLASLLQVMSKVRVKGTRVFADNVVNSPRVQSLGLKKSTGPDSELSASDRKDDELESLWEELGPVVKSDRSLNGSNGEYESVMSVEDKLSESKKEEHSRSSNPVKGEDNSLLQILDSRCSTPSSSNPVKGEDSSLLQNLDSRCSTPRLKATRDSISRILTAHPPLPKKKPARQDH